MRIDDVIKNNDRACPISAVACFDRHVIKTLINIFNLNAFYYH